MFFGLSALECYLAAVAFFIVVYLFTPRKNIWIPFVLTTVLFTVLAYYIEPDPMDDLSIYFHHMDVFRNDGKAGLDYALEQNWFEWRTYRVSLYYIYFISMLPSNSFLPAITIFIVYSIGFGLLYKAANRFDVSKTNLFFASMFFISTYWYYDTASGIRNGLAFAIAIACTYTHLVERKNIALCYAGYVMAALTHSTGFLPVAIAFLAALTYKTGGKVIKYLLIFGLTGGSALIQFLATITDNSFIQSIAGRAEGHTPGSALETGTMFLVSLSAFVFTAFLLIYFSKYFNESTASESEKRLYKYSCILSYFLIGCSFSGLIFVRFARWIIPVVGALVFMAGMELQKKSEEEYVKRCFDANTFPKQSLFLKFRPIIYLIFIGYTAVHFWYSYNGSSLIWMHFR